ncbi:inter-alpha-trypsin inhibitor heavy chain H4-like [Oratosquilla oratoria]|uniref:inter-alpha-trypsin inhibitor heavy chain H4-like n=1 Tax=Oratosquilla oratoria TaxID=337810 RepID=UPI003F76595F
MGRTPRPDQRTFVTGNFEIRSYYVQTLVISRYAITVVTCQIKNPTPKAMEASFAIQLPMTAFISNLTIEVGGQNYTSLVREKEEARKIYDTARARGANAAVVHQKERDMSWFRVDVNVAEQDEVIFYLTYEELLQRTLGVYQYVVNLHPNYDVLDLYVDVTIHETRNITVLKTVKTPGGELFADAVTDWREGPHTARVQFDPNLHTVIDTSMVSGQLAIQYDIERALDAGDVQIEDGYFVHFFAPSELQYIAKHITFLIDTSSSMLNKIEQVKDALRHILRDLHIGDTFDLVQFSTTSSRLGTMRYTGTAVRKAQKFINNLSPFGGTNIDRGFQMALYRRRPPLRSGNFPQQNNVQHSAGSCRRYGHPNDPDSDSVVGSTEYIPGNIMSHIIIFLSDGKPTEGIKRTEYILENIRKRNRGGAAIFCLAFGDDADMDLLEKISLQNKGRARRMYVGVDANKQLYNFYRELSTPLLHDLDFQYSLDAVQSESLTNRRFYSYFQGSELMVSGKLVEGYSGGLRANITGQGRNGEFFMGVTDWNTVQPPDHDLLDHLHLAPRPRNFIERLWAFQTINDLLALEKRATSASQRNSLRRKALNIALENNFVTPLTSLVVVQRDFEQCLDENNQVEGEGEVPASGDGSGDDAKAKDEGEVSEENGSGKEEVTKPFPVGILEEKNTIHIVDQLDMPQSETQGYIHRGPVTMACGTSWSLWRPLWFVSLFVLLSFRVFQQGLPVK